MARKKNNDNANRSPEPTAPPSPQPPRQEQHRESVIPTGDTHAQDARARRQEIRMDMMRSVITEPLLSLVQASISAGNSEDKFEVIISLNETFREGIASAEAYVRDRAQKWGVKYARSSHYVFACLTASQLLELAEESRKLTREYGPKGSVIYRIWEDSDINVSLTRSLSTVKVDAAQRSFVSGSGRRHCLGRPRFPHRWPPSPFPHRAVAIRPD